MHCGPMPPATLLCPLPHPDMIVVRSLDHLFDLPPGFYAVGDCYGGRETGGQGRLEVMGQGRRRRCRAARWSCRGTASERLPVHRRTHPLATVPAFRPTSEEERTSCCHFTPDATPAYFNAGFYVMAPRWLQGCGAAGQGKRRWHAPPDRPQPARRRPANQPSPACLHTLPAHPPTPRRRLSHNLPPQPGGAGRDAGGAAGGAPRRALLCGTGLAERLLPGRKEGSGGGA